MVIIYRVFLKGFPIFRYQYLPCFMELKCWKFEYINYTIWYIRFHRSIEHLWIEIIKIDTRICHFNIKFRQSYICYWWSYLKFHGDPILSDHWLIIFCYIYFLCLLRDEMINPINPQKYPVADLSCSEGAQLFFAPSDLFMCLLQ